MDEAQRQARKRLKRAKITNGITKSLIAELAEIPRPQFNYWTNGVGKLTESQITRVFRVLGEIEHVAGICEGIGLELNWKNAGFVEEFLREFRQVEFERAQAELDAVLGQAADIFSFHLC